MAEVVTGWCARFDSRGFYNKTLPEYKSGINQGRFRVTRARHSKDTPRDRERVTKRRMAVSDQNHQTEIRTGMVGFCSLPRSMAAPLSCW
jgi:hypothetical protein